MSNLKEYIVVMRHDAVPSIWTRSQWRDYLKNCEETGHPNTKETGYYILTTFNASDELKDSPYQGSAGVWRKASNGKPKVKGIYITRRPTLEGSNWIYADVTYNPKYGDTYIDQWENFGLEWLDESAASPAGDGWVSVEEQMPEHNIGVLVFIPDEDDHITSGMWDIEDKWVLLDDYRVPECEVTHWRPLPTPPKTSV